MRAIVHSTEEIIAMLRRGLTAMTDTGRAFLTAEDSWPPIRGRGFGLRMIFRHASILRSVEAEGEVAPPLRARGHPSEPEMRKGLRSV
jgi:hypothetical protein